MSAKTYWIGAIIAVIAAGALFYFLTQSSSVESKKTSDTKADIDATHTSPEVFTEIPLVTKKVITASDPTHHYTINVTYPEVSLATHEALAAAANDVIEKYVNDIVADFKSSATGEDITPDPNDASDLTVEFTSELLAPTLISIRFDESAYMQGAAHPNNQARVLNYNIANKTVISTAGLFASSTQALPFLSDYTKVALRKQFTSEGNEEYSGDLSSGTEPTAENFRAVAITKTGLLVIFNPYQVASYARGAPEVTIPYTDLDDVINPEIVDAIKAAKENIVEATPML